MSKSNFKIFTLRFISEELLAQFMPKLSLLEAQTNTSISFNFGDQFFQIEGENRKECEEVVDIISEKLVPILNDGIRSAFEGTFLDIVLMKPIANKSDKSEINRENTDENLKQRFNITGKPLGDLNEKETEEDSEQHGFTLEELSYDPELIVKEFHISPLVKNVDKFLIGPPPLNMQPAEYLNVIPRLTSTECSLQKRCIVITGEESCVNDAYSRFKTLQNVYIAHSNVTHVACIHYPHTSGHFGLYFCKLHAYRQQHYVHLSQHVVNPFVILPVFFDHNTNEYGRPNDLIVFNTPQVVTLNYNYAKSVPQITPNYAYSKSEPQIAIKYSHAKSNPQVISNYDYTKSEPQIISNHSYAQNTSQSSPDNCTKSRLREPDSPVPTHSTTPMSIPITIKNKASKIPKKDDIPSRSSPPSVMEFHIPEIPKMDAETFPQLTPSRPPSQKRFSPTMSAQKVRVNRVIRIVPQKSIQEPVNCSPIVTERVKTYNYNNIKNALEKGLDSVRGFKGEIRLSARLGKVLWTNIPASVEGNIWNYYDINDIVMKELGAAPKFSDVATIYDHVIEAMSSEDVLQQSRPYMKTAIYEFHCKARNQPTLPFKNTVIHMNQGVIDVKKVVLKEEITTAIDWISLDRKFDFQMYITTKVLTRRNVKPYSTFIKTVSICPITRLMSFENVPKFLDVDFVLLKQTTKFKIALPFVVEVTRVEQVPLRPVPNTAKINAQPGSGGKVWYEYEVVNTINNSTFEENLDLDIGKEARWTSKDILYPTMEGSKGVDIITDYVKNMLTIIERVEKSMSNIEKEDSVSSTPSEFD